MLVKRILVTTIAAAWFFTFFQGKGVPARDLGPYATERACVAARGKITQRNVHSTALGCHRAEGTKRQ